VSRAGPSPPAANPLQGPAQAIQGLPIPLGDRTLFYTHLRGWVRAPESSMSCIRSSRLLLIAGPVLWACGGAQPTQPDGLSIELAPLTLPGLSDACYDLRVTNATNGSGEVVWQRGTPGLNGGTPDDGSICADRFGDGEGAITWVGPCDASGQLDADPASERINSVTLWVDGLYDEGGTYLDPDGPQGFRDPCPGGCTLDVLCEENADTAVRFDLTIMRQANQGFFDVAVAFEDIFCSAKLDTCYEGDRHIELLLAPTRPGTGPRSMGLRVRPGAAMSIRPCSMATSPSSAPAQRRQSFPSVPWVRPAIARSPSMA
jgi:hypothetical protein